MKTNWREFFQNCLTPELRGNPLADNMESIYQAFKARLIEELKVGLSVNDIETIQHPYKGTVCRFTYSKDGPLSAFLFEDSDDKSQEDN